MVPGNKHDIAAVETITKNLKGLLFGDKGYLSKKVFENLFARGLKLITNIKSNMKNKLLPLIEKVLLRKRFTIETVFDLLRNKLNLWNNRHRSSQNAFTHLMAALVAYSIKPNKPVINLTKAIPN